MGEAVSIPEGPTASQSPDDTALRVQAREMDPREVKDLASFHNWSGANYSRLDLTTPALLAVLIVTAVLFGAWVARAG